MSLPDADTCFAEDHWILQRRGPHQTRYDLNTMVEGKVKLTIGRKIDKNDIACPGHTVSKMHCELEFNDDKWFVKDLASMNGTYINKKKINKLSPEALKVGDVLGIGVLEHENDLDYFLFDVLKNAVLKNKFVPVQSCTAKSSSNDQDLKEVSVVSTLVENNTAQTSFPAVFSTLNDQNLPPLSLNMSSLKENIIYAQRSTADLDSTNVNNKSSGETVAAIVDTDVKETLRVIEEMEIVGIIPNYNNTEFVVKSNSPDTLNQTSDTTAVEKVIQPVVVESISTSKGNKVRKKRTNKEAIFIVDSLPKCVSPPVTTSLFDALKRDSKETEMIAINLKSTHGQSLTSDFSKSTKDGCPSLIPIYDKYPQKESTCAVTLKDATYSFISSTQTQAQSAQNNLPTPSSVQDFSIGTETIILENLNQRSKLSTVKVKISEKTRNSMYFEDVINPTTKAEKRNSPLPPKCYTTPKKLKLTDASLNCVSSSQENLSTISGNPQTSTFPTANLFQSNGDAFEADWTEISESESENSVKSDDRNLNFIDVKGSIESLLAHEIKNLSPPLVISTNNNSTLRDEPYRQSPDSSSTANELCSTLKQSNYLVEEIRKNRDPRRNRGNKQQSIVLTPPQSADSRPITPVRPSTPLRPLSPLIEEIKLRILNWNLSWLTEQENPENSGTLPPILQAVKLTNEELPKLVVQPYLTDYPSNANYFRSFRPLILHEVWSRICRDAEAFTEHSSAYQILIKDQTPLEGDKVVLKCEAFFTLGQRLTELDLVTVALNNSAVYNHGSSAFGIVGSVQWDKLKDSTSVDPLLLNAHGGVKPENYQLATFTLQVKKIPPNAMLNHVYPVHKVTSLRSIVKYRLSMESEFEKYPLGSVILKPSKHEDAFNLLECTIDEREKAHLNPTQEDEIVHSLSRTFQEISKPKVALLQGPSGTGKTILVVDLVVELMDVYQKKNAEFPRIFICSPSNATTNDITFRLMKRLPSSPTSVKIVRVGLPSSIAPNVSTLSLDQIVDEMRNLNLKKIRSPYSEEIDSLRKEMEILKSKKKKTIANIEVAIKGKNDAEADHLAKLLDTTIENRIEKIHHALTELMNNHSQYLMKPENQQYEDRNFLREKVLGKADVILTTLDFIRDSHNSTMDKIFASKTSLLEPSKRPFLCCIIDDASKCSESETLLPLGLGIDKLLLVGDSYHQQSDSRLNSLDLVSENSLFNRLRTYLNLLHPNKPMLTLNTQYRMASSIFHWPAEYFYGNSILTSPRIDRDSHLRPYMVLDITDGVETVLSSNFRKSIYNTKEAQTVIKTIGAIISTTKTKSIGVITFYQKQRKQISDEIRAKFSKDVDRITVNTVDSFVQEKDIIIVSCVRATERRGDVGFFLNSRQLMNFALTRAKETLIVCGHFQSLKASDAWNCLQEQAKVRQVVHAITSNISQSKLIEILLKPV